MAFKPEKEQPLEAEEAHEEANMLRAELRINPETGKMHTLAPERMKNAASNREPTAEDYDEALQILEELREEAKRNPTTIETLKQVAKLASLPLGLSGALVLRLVHTFGYALPGALPPKIVEASPDIRGRWKESKEETDRVIALVFDDAESQLKRLKGKAQQFGEKEIQSDAEKPE